MDIPELPATAPVVIRWLVYASLGMAAVVSLWKNVRRLHLLQFIAGELRSNGGTSLKDLVTKTEKDSKDALALTQELTARATEATEIAKVALEVGRKTDGRTRRIVGKQKEYAEKMDRIEARGEVLAANQEAMKERLSAQDEKFARFVVHEARNDLYRSRLLEEEQKLLQESGHNAPEKGADESDESDESDERRSP